MSAVNSSRRLNQTLELAARVVALTAGPAIELVVIDEPEVYEVVSVRALPLGTVDRGAC